MTAADRIDRQFAKLLVVNGDGAISHLPRVALASLFRARRPCRRQRRGDAARELAWRPPPNRRTNRGKARRLGLFSRFRRFVAVVFGAGDHRMLTEDRPPPSPLSSGDKLEFGPLIASVECVLDHPRLVRIRFAGSPASVMRDLARHGRPIQYAHVPEPLRLWDVWTKIAANPIAFESPSAGFALDWRTLKGWRERGVDFATLSHAAGLSSTGDAALDQRLPLDEFYFIPEACASAIEAAKSRSGRVVAIGTSVVRALESAANADRTVRARRGPSERTHRSRHAAPCCGCDRHWRPSTR